MFKSQLSIFQMSCFILTRWHVSEVEAHVAFTFLALQIRPYSFGILSSFYTGILKKILNFMFNSYIGFHKFSGKTTRQAPVTLTFKKQSKVNSH